MNSFQISSLHAKRRIVALHNGIEDAAGGSRLGDLLHPLAKDLMGLVKSIKDGSCVGGAAGNIVSWVVGIDNRQTIRALVNKRTYISLYVLLALIDIPQVHMLLRRTDLSNIAHRPSKRNGINLKIEM